LRDCTPTEVRLRVERTAEHSEAIVLTVEDEPDMGAPIRLSDKTSGVRSRKAMSRRLQFDEPQGLVEVLAAPMN
jgi:hypothetical protein